MIRTASARRNCRRLAPRADPVEYAQALDFVPGPFVVETLKTGGVMSLQDGPDGRDNRPRRFLTSRAGLVLLGFLAIAGALLFTEHRAHVLGALIWLPLLLCPLMHLFMHGKHGKHGGHGRHADDDRPNRERGGP